MSPPMDSGERFDRDIEKQSEMDAIRLEKKKGTLDKIRDFLKTQGGE